jgi:hypothetical protein
VTLVIDSPERSYGLAERLNLAEKGKRFVCNFIEPGIVDYRDSGGGIELIKRETIQNALNTFVGNPLTLGHVPRKNLTDRGVAHGFVDKVKWNGETGWFDCEGTVSTDQARTEIRNGKRPSCGYTVLEYGPGGVYHNIPYDAEITKIQFHHLAIVENPRYEAADIRCNSKEKTTMLKLFKKLFAADGTATTPEERLIALEQNIEVDGKPVRLNAILDAHKAKVAADAKLELEKANKVGDDDEIEVDGKRVKMNELISCYRQYGQKENEKGANTEESEEAKGERQRANEAAAKKKADDEAAAAVVKENELKAKTEADTKAKAERENGAAAFALLEQARNLPPAASTDRVNSSGTMAEGVARGQSRYGSPGRN